MLNKSFFLSQVFFLLSFSAWADSIDIDTTVCSSSLEYLEGLILKQDDSLLCATYPEVAVKSRKVKSQRTNFSHALQLHYSPDDATKSDYLIIAKRSLYDSLSIDLKMYSEDVHAIFGYGIYLETVTDDTPETIKSLICSYRNRLCGVLLVGNIASAFYEVENDHNLYGYRHWPCDLFYMDLDGIWTDSDSNGKYDSHTGNVAPEIFLGRLSAYGLSSYGSEVELIRNQLQKSHKYWWKESFHVQETSLNYKDIDFRRYFSPNYIKKVFSTEYITEIRNEVDSCFSASDYITRISSNVYGFTHLAAHSSPIHHEFTRGDTVEGIFNIDIKNIDSNNYAYSLYCCSACNWTAGNSNGYLGGAYLFNKGKTIAVVGTTKTGGMKSASIKHFYSQLESNNLGEAYCYWWNQLGNIHSHSIICWNYGMTLLGDPTIDFRYKVSNRCVNDLTLTSFPSENSSNLIVYKAGNSITVSNSFTIPQGVHVVFDAPQVVIENGFICPIGSSFEIRSEGCEL